MDFCADLSYDIRRMTDLEKYDDLVKRLEELRMRWLDRGSFSERLVHDNNPIFGETSLANEINTAQQKVIKTLADELYDVVQPNG